MHCKKIRIIDLPEEERPYERCLKYGPGALTDSELLAIIIRTGNRELTAKELAALIILNAGGNLAGLNSMNVKSLTEIKGIGRVKAVELMCLTEISRRISKSALSVRTDFSCPSDVAAYYMEDMRHLKREQLLCVFLDSKNRRISDEVISIGTVNSSLLSPREIFIEALKRDAVAVILLHNHPSGDPEPSRADLSSTRKVSEAGNILGIRLLDHIIIGDNCYVSLRELGEL